MKTKQKPGKIHKESLILFTALLLGQLLCFFPSWFECFFLDLQFFMAQLFYHDQVSSKDIAVVVIDKASESTLRLAPGSQWRQYHATLIDKLTAADAALIVFDVQFFSRTEKWDTALVASLQMSGRVLAGELDEGTTLPEIKSNLLALGNVHLGTYWQTPRQVVRYPADSQEQALAYEVSKMYCQRSPLPTPACGSDLPAAGFWINYGKPVTFFPQYSYIDVLRMQTAITPASTEPAVSPAAFKHKIVFVGYYTDNFSAPLLVGSRVPAVLAHAYATQSLLDGKPVARVPVFIQSLCLWLELGCLVVATRIRRRLLRNLIYLSLFSGAFILSYGLLIFRAFWLGYAAFFAAAVCYLGLLRLYQQYLLSGELRVTQKLFSELEGYNRQLLAKDQIKEFLVGSLVHDIKNCLASIDASLKFLAASCTAESKTDKYVKITKAACNDIFNLSSNMLDVARLEEGKMVVTPVTCDHRLIFSLVEKLSLDAMLDLKRLTFSIEPALVPLAISADVNLLERVLRNLFNNAVKFTPSGGRISFSCYRTKDEQVLSLFNTGKAIPPESREWIFEKYTQITREPNADAHVPHEYQAYARGLGLYFCRLVMNAHRGRIWVENDNAGNYFKLAFYDRIAAS